MKHSLFGVGITVGSREDVLSECRSLVGRGGAVFTLNALMLERARRDPDFCRVLAEGDICTVDGIGVRLALAYRGVLTDCLPGVELAPMLVAGGSPSLAIIGGREGIAEAAFSYLKERNPSLRRSFVISGFGHTEDEYLDLLRRHRPRICLVCLGSPWQERFAVAARSVSPKTLLLALGGSLDIYSGALPRAPRLVRALGLEWLFRMTIEPRRFSAIPSLAAFAIASLTENLTKNKQKSRVTDGQKR